MATTREMQMMQECHLLQSKLRFHWAGWTARPVDLYRQGWQFTTTQRPMDMGMEIGLRHRDADVVGYGRMGDRELRYAEGMIHGMLHGQAPRDIMMRFHFGSDIQFRVQEPMPQFRPVVPMNRMDLYDVSVARELLSFRQMSERFFKPLPVEIETAEVIPPTFDEILDMALANQKGKQDEIRKKMLDHKRRESSGLIISVAA